MPFQVTWSLYTWHRIPRFSRAYLWHKLNTSITCINVHVFCRKAPIDKVIKIKNKSNFWFEFSFCNAQKFSFISYSMEIFGKKIMFWRNSLFETSFFKLIKKRVYASFIKGWIIYTDLLVYSHKMTINIQTWKEKLVV